MKGIQDSTRVMIDKENNRNDKIRERIQNRMDSVDDSLTKKMENLDTSLTKKMKSFTPGGTTPLEGSSTYTNNCHSVASD